MIRKAHPADFILAGSQTRIHLLDEHGGQGSIALRLSEPSRYVRQPATPNIWGYGWYEADQYCVVGLAEPGGNASWLPAFGLKRYPSGHVLPVSVESATWVPTVDEANALVNDWIATGGQGLALEHPDVTKQKALEATSAFAYRKASYWLSQLTDADLTRLAEAAAGFAVKRAEKEKAKAERAAEKKRKADAKAAEKVRKAEAAARKVEEKRIKAEERARKTAEAAARKVARVRV